MGSVLERFTISSDEVLHEPKQDDAPGRPFRAVRGLFASRTHTTLTTLCLLMD